MPGPVTAHYGWQLPLLGGDPTTWGAEINTVLGQVDSQVYATANPNLAPIYSIPSTNVKGTLAFLNKGAPTGRQTRWALIEDTVAETGSPVNTGSNLSLAAYSDAGAQISTPLTFNRASGAATFAGAATFSNTLAVTGAATLSGSLSVTGVATLSGGIKGVVDGSNAAAGQVGEYLTATVGPTNASWGVVFNACTLTLTPGDWDVWGQIGVVNGVGGTQLAGVAAGISLASATLPAILSAVLGTPNYPLNGGFACALLTQRVNVTASTPVYAVVQYNGVGGTNLPTTGRLYARRVR